MDRKKVGRQGGWLSKVTPGVPFALVEGGVSAEPAPRKPRLSARTLRDLGELMTVTQVAERLKVRASTVYGWIYEGKLRKTPINKHIRVAMTDLEEFLKLA